jgi:hypothetical protein
VSAKTVAWASRKASPDKANKEFAKQAEKMARKGYEVAHVEIVQCGRSKRSWLLLGILSFARGKQVQVVATFRLAGAA